MFAWSPLLTGGLHANKKNEIRSAGSQDISSLNLGVVNSSQTYGSDSISTNRPMTKEEKLYNPPFKTGDGKAKWF
jgi:hypothetical protein